MLTNTLGKIFLSYKRSDIKEVYNIYKEIEQRSGVDCIFLVGGEDGPIDQSVKEAINSCNIFLFFYSKSHLEITDFKNVDTIQELEFAKSKNKEIHIINLDDTEPSDYLRENYSSLKHTKWSEPASKENLFKEICDTLGWSFYYSAKKEDWTIDPKTLYLNRAEENWDNKNYAKAHFYFQEAAKLDNKQQNAKSILNNSGKSDYQDNSQAFRLYNSLADQGNISAQYALGKCYFDGIGVEKDQKEAVKWFELAAQQGNANAQYALNICYLEGVGVEQNKQEAHKWYLLAARQGHPQPLTDIAKVYYYASNDVLTYEWYKLAAEQGNTKTQCSLAYFLYTEQNFTEAAKWWRLAAEEGNDNAQYELGKCYYYGKGVEQNFEEAVKWYEAATKQCNAHAQFELGDCYYYGNGVKQSYEEAVKWYKLAAAQGMKIAQKELGDCYFFGKGVEVNLEEAAKWFKKSTELGYQEYLSPQKVV